MIYRGPTTSLIQLSKDDLRVAPSRLATLRRVFGCASSYAATARGTLSRGSAPSGYSSMGLFDRAESSENGITTFECTYYGVLNTSDYDTPYVTRAMELKEISRSYTGVSGVAPSTSSTSYGITEIFQLPVYKRAYVLASGTETTLAPPSAADVVNSQTIYIMGGTTTGTAQNDLTGASTWVINPSASIGADSGLTASDVTPVLSALSRNDWGNVTEVTESWSLVWSIS